MDRRFITVLGVSLLFALVVTSVFYQAINRNAPSGKPDKVEATNQKDLVVAVKPLAMGSTIKTGDVKLTKIQVELFPKHGFSKVEEVLDRPIMSNILQDEPVLEPRLAQRGSGGGIAPSIPDGMRAAAVRVTDDSAVAGFVLPGMRVDVLVTGRPGNGGDTVTRTVLQNILVLSAGTTIQADARGQAVNAPTVTLLVSPDQAETLTLAGNEGRIKLVLRNGGDTKESETTGKNMNNLYTGSKRRPSLGGGGPGGSDDDGERPRVPVRRRAAAVAPVEAEPVAPRPPVQAPPDQIVMIRGDKRSVEMVKPASNGVPDPPPPNQ